MSHKSVSLLLLLAAALTLTCATRGTRKYPPRRPGCELAVFTSELPQIRGSWDDIGVAQATCYLDEGDAACLHRLRVEACRMGGDIMYSVPKRVSRPVARGMMIRARVAHTVASPAAAEKENQKEEEPPPAPASANAPIVPIGAPIGSPIVAPIPIPDGGAAPDAPGVGTPGE
jgi:hypothetical protein